MINWMASLLISAVISLFIGIAFQRPIETLFANLFAWVPPKANSIAGKWIAVFTLERRNKKECYCEIIELNRLLNKFVGTMKPKDRQIPKDRKGEKMNGGKTVTRVIGEMKDDIFKGYWFHPSMNSKREGSFLLQVNQKGAVSNFMTGKWIGYVKAEQSVISGKWFWVKYDKDTWDSIVEDNNFLKNLKKTDKGANIGI